ncbi:MAG: hypothetical protein R3A44_07010 [Caldilineaceae bacterium]
MRCSRSFYIVSLLVILGMLLAACGPRATGGATAAMAGTDKAAIDMPSLVIDINNDGSPSVGNMPLASLAQMANMDSNAVASLRMDPAVVAQLSNANIQHIQIDNTTDGILVLVNGQPIPFFVWDDSTLSTTAEVANSMGFNINMLDKLLPLVRTLGLGIIVRFPVAEDQELIPTVVLGDESAALAAREAQQAYLNAVGSPPKIQLIVDYAPDGTWTMADLTEAEWKDVAPIPWEALNLNPGVLEGAKNAGINTVGLATNSNGIYISVNGKSLPYISWNNGELQHTLQLMRQLGLLDQMMGANPNMDQLMSTIDQFLPIVQAAELNLVVNFPQ